MKKKLQSVTGYFMDGWMDLSMTGGFPSQRASHSENVSILWRYHVIQIHQRLMDFPHKKIKKTFDIFFDDRL